MYLLHDGMNKTYVVNNSSYGYENMSNKDELSNFSSGTFQNQHSYCFCFNVEVNFLFKIKLKCALVFCSIGPK